MNKILFIDCPNDPRVNWHTCMEFINREMSSPHSHFRTFGPNEPPTFEGATGTYEIPNQKDRCFRIAGHIIAATCLNNEVCIWTYDRTLGVFLKQVMEDFAEVNRDRRAFYYSRNEQYVFRYDRGWIMRDGERLIDDGMHPSIRLTIDARLAGALHGVVASFQMHGKDFVFYEESCKQFNVNTDAICVRIGAEGRTQFICGFIEEILHSNHSSTELLAFTHSQDFGRSINEALLCTSRSSKLNVYWLYEYPESIVRGW